MSRTIREIVEDLVSKFLPSDEHLKGEEVNRYREVSEAAIDELEEREEERIDTYW